MSRGDLRASPAPPARDGMAAAAPSGRRSALLQFGPPPAKEQNEAPGTYPPRWTLAAAERGGQGSGSVSVTWGVQAPVSSSSLPTRPEISLLCKFTRPEREPLIASRLALGLSLIRDFFQQTGN